MNYADPDFIIFGGTFDPPHLGHLQCVKSALQRFPKSEIVIMPAALAPVIMEKTKNQYSFAHRLDLCEKMFGSLDPIRVSVSDLENKLARPNYSINTLEALQELHPEKNIGFLMGLDQFKNLKHWKDYHRLLLRFSIVVARRHEKIEQNIQDDSYQLWIEKFVSGCGLDIAKIKGLFYLNDVNSPESSSEIRQNLQRIS